MGHFYIPRAVKNTIKRSGKNHNTYNAGNRYMSDIKYTVYSYTFNYKSSERIKCKIRKENKPGLCGFVFSHKEK